MPTATIKLSTPAGLGTITAIDCGSSSPKLGGVLNISAFPNIKSFRCIDNAITSIGSISSNSLLQTFRLDNNSLSTANIENITTSIFSNRTAIQSSTDKNIDFVLTGASMGAPSRTNRLNNVNQYQALLDKQNFNINYRVNGETDQTWNGGGTSNNFSAVANWTNSASPLVYDALYFGGSTRLTPVNDLTAGTEFNGITFNSGAGAFTLSGNAFGLTFSGITNNSSNTQTISNNITLLGPIRTINGLNKGVNLALTGVISGSSNLNKTGLGTCTLSGANTYIGNTTITDGILSVTRSSSLGTGSVTIQRYNNPIPAPPGSDYGYNSGQLRLSNGITISNNITASGQGFDGYTGAIRNESGTNTISGNIDATTDRFTRFTSNSGTLVIAGNITLTNGLSYNNLFQHGFGDIRLDGNIIGSSTTICILGPTGGGSSKFLVLGRSDVWQSTVRLTLGVSGQTSYGRLDLNGNNQTVSSIATLGTEASGNLITNSSTTASTLTINAVSASSANNTFAGNLSVIKTGTSILTINAVNSYTGSTTISGGTLRVTNTVSAPTGSTFTRADFTNTTLAVTFSAVPPTGNYRLLPGSTTQTYASVSLVGASGRIGSYNSSTSTLTIS